MKKSRLLSFALAVMMALCVFLPLQSLAAQPGDVVSETFTISSGNPFYLVYFEFAPTDGLEIAAKGAITSSWGAGSVIYDVANRKAIAYNPAIAPGVSGASSLTIAIEATVKEGVTTDQSISFSKVRFINSEAEVMYDAATDDLSQSGNSKTIPIDAPAAPETWDKGVVSVEPTCDKPGVMLFTSDKGDTKEEAIKALGHDWGEWTVTKAANCTEAGTSQRVCITDAAHKETRVDLAFGHKWGEWAVVTPANCITKGLEQRVCEHDAKHVEYREIPLVPHQEGEWEIVKQPDATKKENGLRVMKCTVGGEILKEEEIPFVTTNYFYKNTASTQGLRFRDVRPELTDKWYMFTPVDLSVDGIQEFPIIASNIYYIGTLKLTVLEGKVTALYQMVDGVKVHKEFLSYFADLAIVHKVEPSEIAYKKLPFGQPVSIEEELKGDTRVLLYTHFLVDYNDDLKVTRFNANSAEYKALVTALKELMD